MASIFKKDDNFVDKPNRNTFDLSFQNNLSLKFGKLIPCMCQEVLPGDSFQIKPTFGLRFLPQVFPVQTRMRAHLHFFYVRNRTIWKDWMDFIGKTKENLTLPYLDTSSPNPQAFSPNTSFYESSIYDYMGLPVTLDSSVNPQSFSVNSSSGNIINAKFFTTGQEIDNNSSYSLLNASTVVVNNEQNILQKVLDGSSSIVCLYRQFQKPVVVHKPNDRVGIADDNFYINYYNPAGRDVKIYLYCSLSSFDTNDKFTGYIHVNLSNLTSTAVGLIHDVIVDYNDDLQPILKRFVIDDILGYFVIDSNLDGSIRSDIYLSVRMKPSLNKRYPFTGLSSDSLPYGSNALQMRISALPFRAYEAVYNSFYRNSENNPFKIDGVPEYNRYVKSIDGGSQRVTDFKLFNRNWEDDAYTTAVPTPQQGNAPRVGLTGNPNEPLALRVYDQDGNISTVNLLANENGQITVAEGFSGETNTIVNALNDAVNFGITINDLRNVNSLQLWLEKNVRKGYKYRDQMLSHYGVAIDYDDLMIPEFIGGVSRDVTVNQISQTVETSDGNLGDMAGQAYVVGDGEHIRKYCPEHGYIIGIVSVVPVPNYNQRIPKHFFKHDTFDYFFPEFGKIGMQPIENKEITPINSWLSRNMEETFGYQRAWYDYLANVDEVHGKFNSDFYNFLLQRKFDEVPELGESFTTVINEDLNNIFYTESDEDKILGQIYFDIKAIRPIPLFGIPSLE